MFHLKPLSQDAIPAPPATRGTRRKDGHRPTQTDTERISKQGDPTVLIRVHLWLVSTALICGLGGSYVKHQQA